MRGHVHHFAALRRGLGGILLAAILAGGFGACGGSSSNGVASKSPAEILAAAKAAALSATSVHLRAAGGEVLVDVNLASSGGTGQLRLAGAAFELRRTGTTLYLKSTPAVYRSLGITATVPHNAWLRTPASSSRQLAVFTEMNEQLNRSLRVEGALVKGATTTLNGQKVVELKDIKKVYSRYLFVATTGKPYPVEILLTGQVTGKTTLSAWNKPVTLTPPPKSIDVSQLKR
jgi:hypothetical protein